MKSYKGNRFPFCCALFTETDAPEVMSVLETLERQKIRCAVPTRRRADCIARAAVILLFLSPEAIRDKILLKGIDRACSTGKTVLTVFLRETRLTPGLSMQLGQMQAIPKFRAVSDEAFYEKLLNAPALQTMSVTPQQKKALRRKTLFAAVGGAVALAAALLIGLYWRPIKAMLPTSPLQRVGVPLDFDSIETLYVYGETQNDVYEMPLYRICADGEHDWAKLDEQMIPQGDISKLDDFALLGNLKEFCICNNSIDSIQPILSLTKLTLLDVSHNRISDLSGIDALSELETLNVSYNSISNLNDIAKLERLRILNVSHTGLSSLKPLASMPSLKTVYIDADLLDAAKALGETPFEIICLDTPVYQYSELVSALNDPLATDIRMMQAITVPRDETISIRPDVVLSGRNEQIVVSVYGTVRIFGVWDMNCKQYIYGTVLVENGGVCYCEKTTTTDIGVFRVETGGRHSLQHGAVFSFAGGSYENNGDVCLRRESTVRFISGGDIVNNGSLHLRVLDLAYISNDVPTDKIINNGIVYLDGIPLPNKARTVKNPS